MKLIRCSLFALCFCCLIVLWSCSSSTPDNQTPPVINPPVLADDFSGTIPRVALLEEFTNASCGPCAAQNPTFKKFLATLNNKEVIPLVFRSSWPGRDPMYSANTVMNDWRVRTYYNVMGVPFALVDGSPASKGPSYYEGAPGDTTALSRALANRRKTTSVTLGVMLKNTSGDNYTAEVTLQSQKPFSQKNLRVVVVERKIVYDSAPGTNGEKEFEHVARHIMPSNGGEIVTVTTANSPQKFTFSFTANPGWKKDQLYVIAFLQNDTTKEIIQATESAH